MDWAKQQRKTVGFDVPDKQPYEQPATKKQLDYIRSMLRGADENVLRGLGKWQASALLDQIKTERGIFTEEKLGEYRTRGFIFGMIFLIVLAAIILFVIFR